MDDFLWGMVAGVIAFPFVLALGYVAGWVTIKRDKR